MKTKNVLAILYAIAALSASPLVAATQVKFATVLIDKSTSMNTKRTVKPDTRCLGANELAVTVVSNFFRYGGEAVNVKVFGDYGDLESITGGFIYNEYDAISAITQHEGCSLARTALGQGICQSVDEIRRYTSGQLSRDESIAILVMTDGKENASPANECGNDTSRGNEWQDKVRSKLKTEGDPIVFNSNLFQGSVEKSLGSGILLDHAFISSLSNSQALYVGKFQKPSNPKYKKLNNGLSLKIYDNYPLPKTELSKMFKVGRKIIKPIKPIKLIKPIKPIG